MVSHVTHYYKQGATPFQTLSALPDDEALRVMEKLGDDSPLFARFKTPAAYMASRKQTEQWLCESFIAKGKTPVQTYPLYAVYGQSAWIEKYGAAFNIVSIRIPLSLFVSNDISFTYPDSMISYEQRKQIKQQSSVTNSSTMKPSSWYGQVFTMDEVKELVASQGLPEQSWTSELSEESAPYIEAQIWNDQILHNLI
ncbi:hypothetical protein ACFSTH_12885 [Paenibacillus yanchengensis]|uniref:Uncharacterized protein n=1 Tax=Paenibacillus yanchengensis TaxID=2035833 RepID=A0ABW4YPF2_9BACL